MNCSVSRTLYALLPHGFICPDRVRHNPTLVMVLPPYAMLPYMQKNTHTHTQDMQIGNVSQSVERKYIRTVYVRSRRPCLAGPKLIMHGAERGISRPPSETLLHTPLQRVVNKSRRLLTVCVIRQIDRPNLTLLPRGGVYCNCFRLDTLLRTPSAFRRMVFNVKVKDTAYYKTKNMLLSLLTVSRGKGKST